VPILASLAETDEESIPFAILACFRYIEEYGSTLALLLFSCGYCQVYLHSMLIALDTHGLFVSLTNPDKLRKDIEEGKTALMFLQS
jgi:hypothetical protein